MNEYIGHLATVALLKDLVLIWILAAEIILYLQLLAIVYAGSPHLVC